MASLANLIGLYGGAALIFACWIVFFAFLFVGLKLINYYGLYADFNFSKIRNFFYKGSIYVLTLPFFAFLLFYISAVPIVYYQYKICAEFPNGVLMGRTSFLDARTISRLIDPYPDWLSVSLKLPDGTILIRGDISELHFSKSTVYATIDTFYRFAYRLDVGLVLAEENLELYSKLKKEAGELITPPLEGERRYRPPRSDSYSNGYIAKIFFGLTGDSAYLRKGCPLDIFP